MYKVASPPLLPLGGIESICWGKRESEEGKGEGREEEENERRRERELKGMEGKGEKKGKGNQVEKLEGGKINQVNCRKSTYIF